MFFLQSSEVICLIIKKYTINEGDLLFLLLYIWYSFGEFNEWMIVLQEINTEDEQKHNPDVSETQNSMHGL